MSTEAKIAEQIVIYQLQHLAGARQTMIALPDSEAASTAYDTALARYEAAVAEYLTYPR